MNWYQGMRSLRFCGLLVAVLYLPVNVPSVRAEDESNVVDVKVQPAEGKRELGAAEGMAARWIAGRPTTPIERAKALGEPAAQGALIGAATGGPAGAQAGAVGGLLKGAVHEVKKEVNWVISGDNSAARQSGSEEDGVTYSGRPGTIYLKNGSAIEARNIFGFGCGSYGCSVSSKIPCKYGNHHVDIDIYDPSVQEIEILDCRETGGDACSAQLAVTKTNGKQFVVERAGLYGKIAYRYWDEVNEKVSEDHTRPLAVSKIVFRQKQ